jgi:hypothetical protein
MKLLDFAEKLLGAEMQTDEDSHFTRHQYHHHHHHLNHPHLPLDSYRHLNHPHLHPTHSTSFWANSKTHHSTSFWTDPKTGVSSDALFNRALSLQQQLNNYNFVKQKKVVAGDELLTEISKAEPDWAVVLGKIKKVRHGESGTSSENAGDSEESEDSESNFKPGLTACQVVEERESSGGGSGKSDVKGGERTAEDVACDIEKNIGSLKRMLEVEKYF